MKLTFLIILFLFSELVFADIVINELMYNPEGNEYDFEFIEIYGQGNISNYYFEGIDFSFPHNTNINGFLVIANTLNDSGENNDFLDRYPSVQCFHEYVGSLLNSGETIILRDAQGDLVDSVAFDDWVDENYSLERIDIDGYSGDPSNWAQSVQGGSPGLENSVSSSFGCDWTLELITNGSVFTDPEFKLRAIKNKGDGKANLTVKKWIEDSAGNIDKTYSDWSIVNALNYKTSSKYSPSLAKGDAYFIKANIINCSCLDTNLDNNFVSKMIFVPGDKQSTDPESHIKILDVDDEAEFGDTLKVKVSIYRGDTSKYAVYAYVEDSGGKDVSEKSTIHVKDKFTNYTMTIPVQLDMNCNEKYDADDYDLIVEGLGTKASVEIDLFGRGSDCGKTSSCSSSSSSSSVSISSSSSKFAYALVLKPEEIFSNKKFVLKVELQGDNRNHDIDIWSYVYRGSKSYSGDRELNKQTLDLDSGEKKIITLQNIVQASPGDYKVKIKIRKDNQKTTKDITDSISVISEPPEFFESFSQEQILVQGSNFQNVSKKSFIMYDPLIIYESSSYKARKMIPLLMVCLSGLFSILLLIKKTF